LERHILKGVPIDFVDKGWGNVFSCSYLRQGKLPKINFKYGGYWFDVLAEDYTLDFGGD
jgi:hypothetical protein